MNPSQFPRGCRPWPPQLLAESTGQTTFDPVYQDRVDPVQSFITQSRAASGIAGTDSTTPSTVYVLASSTPLFQSADLTKPGWCANNKNLKHSKHETTK